MKIYTDPPIEKLIEYVKENPGKVYGIDFETTGLDPNVDKPLLLAIKVEDEDAIMVYRVQHQKKMYMRALFYSLNEWAEYVVAHNSKFEAAYIHTHFGITMRNMWCTKLASQILNNKPIEEGEEVIRHHLVDVTKRYLGVAHEMEADKDALRDTFIGADPMREEYTQDQLMYAAEDVRLIIEIFRAQQDLIRKMEMTDVMALDNQLAPVLAKMEVGGCRINVDKWKELVADWQRSMEPIKYELDAILQDLIVNYPAIKFGNDTIKPLVDMFGGGMNYGSSTQVVDLFRLTNQPLPMKDGKVSTGERALNTYIQEYPASPLGLLYC